MLAALALPARRCAHRVVAGPAADRRAGQPERGQPGPRARAARAADRDRQLRRRPRRAGLPPVAAAQRGGRAPGDRAAGPGLAGLAGARYRRSAHDRRAAQRRPHRALGRRRPARAHRGADPRRRAAHRARRLPLRPGCLRQRQRRRRRARPGARPGRLTAAPPDRRAGAHRRRGRRGHGPCSAICAPHRPGPETVVLGLAACGQGQPRYWVADGTLLPARFSPGLVELAAETAAAMPGRRPHRGRGNSPRWPGAAPGWPRSRSARWTRAGCRPHRTCSHDTPEQRAARPRRTGSSASRSGSWTRSTPSSSAI